jgi:hypothetical protein
MPANEEQAHKRKEAIKNKRKRKKKKLGAIFHA